MTRGSHPWQRVVRKRWIAGRLGRASCRLADAAVEVVPSPTGDSEETRTTSNLGGPSLGLAELTTGGRAWGKLELVISPVRRTLKSIWRLDKWHESTDRHCVLWLGPMAAIGSPIPSPASVKLACPREISVAGQPRPRPDKRRCRCKGGFATDPMHRRVPVLRRQSATDSSPEHRRSGLEWLDTADTQPLNPQLFLCQARTFLSVGPEGCDSGPKSSPSTQLTRPRDNHRVRCRASPTPNLHDIAGNPLWRRRPASLVVDPASAPEMPFRCKTARTGCFGCRLSSVARLSSTSVNHRPLFLTPSMQHGGQHHLPPMMMRSFISIIV